MNIVKSAFVDQLPQELAVYLVAVLVGRCETHILHNNDARFPGFGTIRPALPFVNHIKNVVEEGAGRRHLGKRNGCGEILIAVKRREKLSEV